jgi:hypothetical protein
MIDDECGTVDGMKIGRGNRSTGRKPAPVPPDFQLIHSSFQYLSLVTGTRLKLTIN